MAKIRKVTHKEFKLATQAGRIGLLCGITAGTVTNAEIEHAIIADTEKRPYRKPVVANGKRYPSITAAAVALADNNRKAVLAMQKTIANWCNADNVEGYYWAN